MKFKSLILSLVLSLVFFNLNAQIIATIGDEQISTKDFLKLYEKNNNPEFTLENLTIEEYLELYINFKMKVKEAEALEMNKDLSFVNEYNKYKDQLAKPYLLDSIAYEKLITESYEHMKYDIRASHILIDVPEAELSDTINAWNKAIKYRDLFLKGNNFNELAFKHSDDPSARERNWDGKIFPANKGDLGYFTAFNMIYPFENAAYQLEVGEVSMPIRSKYGYHIINLTDKKPALGECNVSHLVLYLPKDATAADSAKVMVKANELHKRMMQGEDFEMLVKEHSEDKSTAKHGGKLLSFRSNQIDANFINNIITLQNGEISKPFFSTYGCHIARMNKRGKIGTLEEEREYIIKRITNSDRVSFQDNTLAQELQLKFNYKLNGENYKEVLPFIKEHYDNLSNVSLPGNKELFSYTNYSISQNDFIKYISQRETLRKSSFSEIAVAKYLKDYVYKLLVDLEIEKIALSNDDFRMLLQEYYDGILLFNINEKLVWQKAYSDSTGLVKFYEINKEKYLWEDRVKGSVYTITDLSAAKDVKKALKKGMNDYDLAMKFVNKLTSIDKGTYEAEDNPIVDKLSKKKQGLSDIIYDNETAYIVRIDEVLPAGIKTFEECKGLVISDYQSYLEQEWLKELKEKYPVVINYTELGKIK